MTSPVTAPRSTKPAQALGSRSCNVAAGSRRFKRGIESRDAAADPAQGRHRGLK